MKGKWPNGLAEAMEKRGIGPSELARLVGLPNRQAVFRYRDGERKLPPALAQLMAPHLNTTTDALLLLPDLPEARVAGSVGAGGSITDVNDEDFSENALRIGLIAGSLQGIAAAEIKGDSLGEKFDGWYVLYGERDSLHEAHFDRLCIVRTEAGETAIKWVKRPKSRRKGVVDLISGNGEPYAESIAIQWAALVRGLRPQ